MRNIDLIVLIGSGSSKISGLQYIAFFNIQY